MKSLSPRQGPPSKLGRSSSYINQRSHPLGGVHHANTRLAVYTCPSDQPDSYGTYPLYNYAVNYGNTGIDQQLSLPDPFNAAVTISFAGAPFGDMCRTRAAQAPTVYNNGTVYGFESLTDGSSNTLAASELVQGHGGGGSGTLINNVVTREFRGFIIFGTASGFVTAIPPNSTLPDVAGACLPNMLNNPPCVHGTQATSPPTMFASRSRHPGGVNSVMCDGHVQFFKNSISYKVWRALGTSQGGEVVSSDAY